MRFWFDTEFIEDGHTIDLMSVGIVCEDGREYYAERLECNLSRANDWVKANVIPHLTGETKPSNVIRDQVLEFVGGLTVDKRPEFWAYYGAYDWVALCQLFGRMVDLPKSFPMFCHDVKQLAMAKGNPKLPKSDEVDHHALADARWTKRAWEYLMAMEGSSGFRYRLAVLPDQGGDEALYFIHSPLEIRRELLQVAGLVLDSGLPPSVEADLLQTAQSYVAADLVVPSGQAASR